MLVRGVVLTSDANQIDLTGRYFIPTALLYVAGLCKDERLTLVWKERADSSFTKAIYDEVISLPRNVLTIPNDLNGEFCFSGVRNDYVLPAFSLYDSKNYTLVHYYFDPDDEEFPVVFMTHEGMPVLVHFPHPSCLRLFEGDSLYGFQFGMSYLNLREFVASMVRLSQRKVFGVKIERVEDT